MKKIESGQGASDFGSLERGGEGLEVQEAWVAAGGCVQPLLGHNDLKEPEPVLPPLVTEQWVIDVIYANWQTNKDARAFPHWIANAAKIIVAGR